MTPKINHHNPPRRIDPARGALRGRGTRRAAVVASGSTVAGVHAHGNTPDYYRAVTDIRWTSLTPTATIQPGERTGTYRTGLDDLVTDTDGQSRMSKHAFWFEPLNCVHTSVFFGSFGPPA